MSELELPFLFESPKLGDVLYSNAPRVHLNTNTGEKEYLLQPANAVIIHPSLACPILNDGQSELILFLLINQELYDNYYMHEGDGPSPFFLNRIHYHLYHQTWSARKQKGRKDKLPAKHFYQDTATAYQHMDATTPADIASLKNLVLKDDKDTLALIPLEAVSVYLSAPEQTKRFPYLVRITLQNIALSEGLHNMHWSNYCFDAQDREMREMEEVQDVLMQDALPKTLRHRHAYCVNKAFDFTEDKQQPVKAYHPIYVTKKPRLNFGHLTDIHISSRQFAFQKSKIQVMPGADESISPRLGDCVLNTFDSTYDLMSQIGADKEVDCLVITGDLVDFSYNLKPEYINFDKQEDLWERLTLKGDIKSNPYMEQGIDDLIVYSLVIDYYNKYQKPIYITSGNHDSYEMPYGISPRISSDMKVAGIKKPELQSMHDQKANAGIPLDHNLTSLEAALIYGPDYGKIVQYPNFNYAVHGIFSTLFTPATDFFIKHHKQAFVGLDWGDDEVILANVLGTKGGVLPRSKGLRKRQLALLDQLKPYQDRLLFMHATVVNYAPDVPLKQSQKPHKIYFYSNHTHLLQPSKLDFGSFYRGRKLFFDKVYRDFVATHILSGHSHRPALYFIKDITETISLDNIKTTITPEAHELTGLINPSEKNILSPRIIVTGSGGPISNENIDGELNGQNAAPPSATKILFKHTDVIDVYYARIKQARPRTSAVFDMIEYKGNKISGIITAEINPQTQLSKINLDLIEQLQPLSIYIRKIEVYQKKDHAYIPLKTTFDRREGGSKFTVTGTGIAKIKNPNPHFSSPVIRPSQPDYSIESEHFIAIHFKPGYEDIIGLQNHNTLSPYLVPIYGSDLLLARNDGFCIYKVKIKSEKIVRKILTHEKTTRGVTS